MKFQEVMKILLGHCCAHLNVVLSNLKKNDQREHLMKEDPCTDNLEQLIPTTESSSTNDGNKKGHVPHSRKDKNDFGDETISEENNESGKHTYSTHKA